MTHLSFQSKTFVLLLIVALGTAYGAITLSKKVQVDRLPETIVTPEQKPATLPTVSTEGWDTYADDEYPLLFKYPSTWKVSSITTEPDYYVLAITKPKNGGELRVYINDQDFYALGGLVSTPIKLDNEPANAHGQMLASAKVGKYYYTFDAGKGPALIPEFQAFLTTIEFR
jgi:hypothetical protein